MKETLRILFSAAFLSTVFLCAYNYVNSTADDRENSITSFFGGGSDEQDENASAPTDDSFSFGSADSSASLTPQSFHESPSAPLDNRASDVTLPILAPESQLAPPSAPYGSSVHAAADNAAPLVPESPVVEPLTPDVSMDTVVGPIDPEAPSAIPAPVQTLPPTPPVQPSAVQVISNNVNPAPVNDDRVKVAAFIEDAKQRINNGDIYNTLVKLSQFYNAPEFTPNEAQQVHYLLMQLAGEVIYLHPEKYFNTHTVQPGDTITTIAKQYQVPWQFIAKINGMTAPFHVQPGEQIKVVPGPFNAEVHLDKFELTLWLPIGTDYSNSLYAGTFPIGLGGDCPRLQGDYIVDGKFINPEYPKISNNPTTFGPGDANNPYGKRLLSLTCVTDPNHVKIGIHGTNNSQYIRHSVPYGFICLGDLDINNLYDILSVGSRIKIER